MKWWMVIAAVMMLEAVTALYAQRATTRPASNPVEAEITEEVKTFIKPLEAERRDDDLRRKLKERHNTLVHILELRVQGYHKGLSDAAPIYDAVSQVADAKEQLAENDQERQQIAENLLEVTKFVEARAEQRFKGGFGSEVDLERARLLRENAEVALLKLRENKAATTQPR